MLHPIPPAANTTRVSPRTIHVVLLGGMLRNLLDEPTAVDVAGSAAPEDSWGITAGIQHHWNPSKHPNPDWSWLARALGLDTEDPIVQPDGTVCCPYCPGRPLFRDAPDGTYMSAEPMIRLPRLGTAPRLCLLGLRVSYGQPAVPART